MSVHCPQCGAENLDSAQICFSCGSSIDGVDVDRLIGTVMFDSYLVTRVLGQGGMAVVYQGRNQLTGQEVAIKMLPPELAAYPEVKTRFLQEARTLAKLEHPNLVHLINFAEDRGRLCLVMQYAEGETFEERIERAGRVPPGEVASVGMQVLKALEHAHDNDVVHRDIKPSNIIVRPDGSVKVTDFGIAKITRGDKLTQTGQTMGTVRYMAPEQVRGKDIDHRTDLYSLGVSLYEAFAGSPPFDGESQFEVMQMHLSAEVKPPREAGAPISAQMEAVILRALRKDPEERYQSAAEMHRAMRATAEGKGHRPPTAELMSAAATAPTEARVEAVREVHPRRKGWLIALVLGVVVSIAGASTLYFYFKGAGGEPSGRISTAPEAGVPRPRPPRRPVLPAGHPAIERMEKALGGWAVSRRFGPPHQIYVYSDQKVDAQRIAEAYRVAQIEYRRLLRDRSYPFEVVARPFTLVMVSRRLLNDRSVWEEQVQGKDRDFFYEPPKGLAFVASGQKYTEVQLRYAVAVHLCPLQITRVETCEKLAEAFEKVDKVDFLP